MDAMSLLTDDPEPKIRRVMILYRFVGNSLQGRMALEATSQWASIASENLAGSERSTSIIISLKSFNGPEGKSQFDSTQISSAPKPVEGYCKFLTPNLLND